MRRTVIFRKKCVAMLIIIALLASALPSRAKAAEQEIETTPENQQREWGKYSTNEESMPALEPADFELLKRSNQIENSNMFKGENPNDLCLPTLALPSRRKWVQETEEYLFSVYKQEVAKVSETEDYIVFEFNNPKDLDPYAEHVYKVEYVKPESKLRTNYETKFLYLWGWKSNYYSLGSKQGVWNTIKDLLISVAGTVPQISIYVFAVSIVGIAASSLIGTNVVRATSDVKYYYLNKCVQIKEPTFGFWIMNVEAGIRKGCKRCMVIQYDPYGQPITTGVNETIGAHLQILPMLTRF